MQMLNSVASTVMGTSLPSADVAFLKVAVPDGLKATLMHPSSWLSTFERDEHQNQPFHATQNWFAVSYTPQGEMETHFVETDKLLELQKSGYTMATPFHYSQTASNPADQLSAALLKYGVTQIPNILTSGSLMQQFSGLQNLVESAGGGGAGWSAVSSYMNGISGTVATAAHVLAGGNQAAQQAMQIMGLVATALALL
jgi:hypothetical protein